MLMETGGRVIRAPIWTRIRLQLGGALLASTLLPTLIARLVSSVHDPLRFYTVSLTGATAAVLIGFWVLRNLCNHPGARMSYYVLPTFSSTFGLLFAVMFFTRADYSRSLLASAFILSSGWFYFVDMMAQRTRVLRIAVAPFGRVGSLFDIGKVDWIPLQQPKLPVAVHMLVADFEHDLEPQWEEFLADCALAGVSVLHFKQLRETLTGQVTMEHLAENAFGSLVPNGTYLALKQIGDWVAAVVAVVLLSPVLACLAIAIRLDSRGPVFFVQERVGYRGRPFRMIKFRTMRPVVVGDATARTSAITQDGDRRVTRIGRFLRRSRLDELPQILNILRGEMSWIGPRPEAQVLSRWYLEEIPFYRYRHIVRPGITGWAQVHQGHVAEIEDVMKKLSFDFFYISRFNFWIDVLVVVRTIRTMLTGFGSK